MATIDLGVIKQRESEMRLNVRRSSPVLIWSGAHGIWLIAASKLGRQRNRNRVYRILDRIAYVGRGSAVDNKFIGKVAVVHGQRLALETSRGDVHASQIVEEVGHTLSRAYYNYLGEPRSVEGAIVQLQGTPEEDDLTYINFKGAAHSFEKAVFLGSCDLSGENETQGERDLEELHEQLRDAWDAGADIGRINEIFHGLPAVKAHADLTSAFDAKRIETVLLDRKAFRGRDFRNIFRRLT